MNICGCTACKRAKRKGLILGSRWQGYFSKGLFGWGSVSDYVSHPRLAKGRQPYSRKSKLENDE